MAVYNNKTIISQPYSSLDERSELNLRGKGIDWTLSVVPYTPPTLKILPHERTSNPEIRLEPLGKGLAAQVLEGQSTKVKVSLRNPLAYDVTVDYEILTEEDGLVIDDLPETLDGVLHSGAENVTESFDYKTFVKVAKDADITTAKVGQLTIPANAEFIELDIDTVDDLTYTGGKNTFRFMTFKITGTSATSFESETLAILVEDASPESVGQGFLEVLGQIHPKTAEEPLYDAVAQEDLKLVYGEGSQSYFIQFTLLEKLIFKPTEFTMVDIADLPDNVDPLTEPYWYQIVMMTGDGNTQ